MMIIQEQQLKSRLDKQHSVRSRTTLSLGAAIFLGSLGTVLSIFICLLLLESIFAIAHVGEDTISKPDPLMGYAHIADQHVTFRSEGFSRSYFNKQSFRDKTYATPKPAGVQRVCVIGDSMTLGLEVPLANTFSKQLEKKLQSEGRNIEVLNCGTTGSGTGQQYLNYLKSVSPLKPDMLILAYHQGDTDDNIGGGTNPPRPSFVLNGNNLQVDYQDVDKWLAADDAKFYSSFESFRHSNRVYAVLKKLDFDLSADPTYKFLGKIVAKPSSQIWSMFLKNLPASNWHISSQRAVAGDLLPAAKIKNSQAASSSQSSTLSIASRTATMPKPIKASLAAVSAAALNDPNNGDLNAYRGLLSVHNTRIAVTKEILKRLNQDCLKNHCKLVIASLPAYSNSIMFYREVNELEQFAQEEKIGLC